VGDFNCNLPITRLTEKAESDAAIHELMHAVQCAEIPNARRGWIQEGLAAAVEPFALFHPIPSEDFRYDGNWRSWQNPLNSETDKQEYEAAEFWLSVGGTLAYLPEFLTVVRSGGVLDDTNEYDVVDQGLTAAPGISLEGAYLELLQKRNADPDYPYCPIVEVLCTGDSCEARRTSTQGMTAVCSDFILEFTPACPVGETPHLTIELRGDPAIHKAMVDGQLYEANQAVAVGETFRYWIINLATEPMSPPPLQVVVRRECPKHIILHNQSFHVSASALVNEHAQVNPSEFSRRSVTSWEDGSQPSEETFLHSIDEQPITNLRETIEPVSSGVVGLEVDAAASSRAFPGRASASAEASLSASTSFAASSFAWTGELAIAGVVSGDDNVQISTSVGAGAQTIVNFSVLATAILELSWGCNLEVIVLSKVQGNSNQNLLALSRSQGPWDCVPRSIQLSPGRYNYLVSAQGSRGRGDSRTINSSGPFTIRLQAIQ
jgi:hypothetical protein